MKYLIILIGLMATVQAQTISRSVIGAAGGEGGNLTYTVGEVVTETASGATTLTQGFQQPDTVTVVGVDRFAGAFDLKLYPNPAQEFLYLDVSLTTPVALQVELIDARGRQIMPAHRTQPQAYTQVVLDVRTLAEGTYMLRIRQQDGALLETLKFTRR